MYGKIGERKGKEVIAPDKTRFSTKTNLKIYLLFRENICCRYLLESPRRGAPYEYSQ